MKYFLKIDGKSVHLRQGDMDGACTVYSLMMGLISIGAIKRDDVENVDKKYGRTSKGRLIHEFLKKVPEPGNKYQETVLLSSGYTLSDIQEKLRKSFNRVVDTDYRSSLEEKDDEQYLNKHELEEFIAGEIYEDRPVEICYNYRGKSAFGHAVLVVGYEEDGNGTLIRFFCLDPGEEKPKGNKKYNAVIDLYHNGKRIQYCIAIDEHPVLIHSAMSIYER